jgi:hypothetical protein
MYLDTDNIYEEDVINWWQQYGKLFGKEDDDEREFDDLPDKEQRRIKNKFRGHTQGYNRNFEIWCRSEGYLHPDELRGISNDGIDLLAEHFSIN